MTDARIIGGRAAALRFENLDTDQIMPKQFLRGIDKRGLAEGLLYDLRFDATGAPRPDFVLNRPQYQGVNVLVGGNNFGCGSSREHAVWGLQQFGIQAVVAPSFGEIFYSNAMQNGLLLVMLDDALVRQLMVDSDNGGEVCIEITTMTLHSAHVSAEFVLAPRHRQMFLQGLDVIGMTLAQRADITAFATAHWATQPWLEGIARHAREQADRHS
ncbi:MAG: 3-isopropylmalate dehydratase small subunit [Paucibacter sp.]|nr:3-isopropylmalate dehydratase small subunit [Roseateles sp.]